jgi:hypothetical protein
VTRGCLGFDRTRNYTDLAVQLARRVSFTASPSTSGYAFTIPRADVLIYQGAVVNGGLDAGYKQPSEDVAGTIDFTLGAFTLKAVIATRLHFEEGCLPIIGCLINEDDNGTLTATIAGTIVLPDSDGDGIPDARDNCPFGPNPDQRPVSTPVIFPPANVTVPSCGDHNIGTAFAADACTGDPVPVTSKRPQTFVPGENFVTWIARDSSGHTTEATQIVTVVDTTPPTFSAVPPDITVNNCGPVSLGGLPKATDDCRGPVVFTNDAPASFRAGTTAVTWTATDEAGNRATETQMITVNDTVPPTVACVPAATRGSFQVMSADACAPPLTIRLGSYTLINGEVIKIMEVPRPGVRLVDAEGRAPIRHFQVGPGENVIVAKDGSGNLASAVCR